MNSKPVLNRSFYLAHILLVVLLVTILLPGGKEVSSPLPLLVAIGLAEAVYLLRLLLAQKGNSDIMSVLWGILLVWELVATKLAIAHPLLIPPPENVFWVFVKQWDFMLLGVWSSLKILLVGVLVGIALAVLLGTAASYHPRSKALFFSIAQVMAPIPPIVYAPYLVALMPSFRSASILIVFLGIFFPTFLKIIIQVDGMESELLDSARAMNVKGPAMIGRIYLPYVLPGVISGLKVTLATAIMLLIFAEMMGAKSGMGYFIINYTHYANYTNVIAGIILVGIVITVLNFMVGVIQRHAIRWRL